MAKRVQWVSGPPMGRVLCTKRKNGNTEKNDGRNGTMRGGIGL